MADHQAFQLVLLLMMVQHALIVLLPNMLESSPAIPHPNPCKQDMASISQQEIQLQPILFESSHHLAQHFQDIAFQGLDIGLNLLQRSWRLILVEVAVEVDLVAYFPYFT